MPFAWFSRLMIFCAGLLGAGGVAAAAASAHTGGALLQPLALDRAHPGAGPARIGEVGARRNPELRRLENTIVEIPQRRPSLERLRLSPRQRNRLKHHACLLGL
jgi:hypothetical protein